MPEFISFPREVVLIILIFISGFASASETAFFSLNRFQLRRIRDSHKDSYESIRRLLAKPGRLLIIILLVNETVNLRISSVVSSYFNKYSETNWLLGSLLSMIFTIPLLLILGEITPKIIATKMNRIIATVNATPLYWLELLLLPLLWFVEFLVKVFFPRFKSHGRDSLSKSHAALSEEDFVTLMEEGHREGNVDSDERHLIKNVLEFDDTLISEVMTPLQSSFCISLNSKVSEILKDIKAQKYSRIPIYKKNKKHIVGTIHVKDILRESINLDFDKIEIHNLMSKPMFVRPNTKLSAVFRKFKETKMHIAIVANQTGHALGIVTMEDLLESLFGEIEDERDEQNIR